MSASSNKALIRRFFEQVCDRGDLAAADEVFAPEHVYHDPLITSVPAGPEGIRRVLSPPDAAFTQQTWKVDEILGAENDHVVVRWTGGGKHTGEVMGAAATGKRVTVSGIWIFRLEKGKVVESWNQWDAIAMMRQVGAVPVPA